MNFYVCLPSNVKAANKNVQSNFKTILANPVFLNGEYEVALTELTYSSNYMANFGSISFDDNLINLRIKNGIKKNQLFVALNWYIKDYFIRILNTQVEDFNKMLENQEIPKFTKENTLLYKRDITLSGNISMIISGNNESVWK